MRWSRLLILPLLGGFVGFSTTCSNFHFGAGTSALAQPANRTVDAGGQRLQLARVTGGLAHPWGLAFLPDGGMLVTERAGRLRLIGSDGRLDPEPIAGVPAVVARGQGGLLDVALDPDFRQNRLVYLSYAEPGTGGAGTAVAKARLDGHRLADLTVIFRQQPKVGGNNHFGSRLAFGPDGTLFVTLGERFQMERAQKLDEHLGKIVRIRADGSVPPDNPFVDRPGALAEIWSYGHRNAQGLTFHPTTGRLWQHEHGARGGDEINLVEKGANYGWPLVTHGVDYSGLPIGSGKSRAGLADPLHVWTPSIAPSGMAFYTGDAIPGWKGSLLVGALAYQMLVRLELDGTRITREHRLLEGEIGRIRDVRTGPDGNIYLLTDEAGGGLWRLGPAAG